VVDTSSGTVTAFRALDVYPGPIACGPDGKAAVFLHTAEGAKIGLLDPRTGLLSLSAWRGDNYLMSFVTTNDGLYVGNGYDPGIDTVVIDSNGIRVGEEVNPAVPVIDFTTSTHGTFALTANRRQLFFKPPQEGAGFQELPEILGTLPLGSEVSSLVASGDRVFAIMNKGFDSSSVVVIDARTRERAGTIPLHFSQARSAGVIGRKWYLVGPGHPQWNDGGRKHGGVEVIDLDAADTSVVLVSAEQLGYDVRDYIPLSEHDGYAMCLRPSQSTFLTRIMGARP
jgi:hypothetical protein